VLIAVVAVAVRVWDLNRTGFNSDEVVLLVLKRRWLAGKSQYEQLLHCSSGPILCCSRHLCRWSTGSR